MLCTSKASEVGSASATVSFVAVVCVIVVAVVVATLVAVVVIAVSTVFADVVASVEPSVPTALPLSLVAPMLRFVLCRVMTPYAWNAFRVVFLEVCRTVYGYLDSYYSET